MNTVDFGGLMAMSYQTPPTLICLVRPKEKEMQPVGNQSFCNWVGRRG